LVVGLGNPGPEYELTPHNLGFLTVERLAERNGIRVSRPEAMALVGVGEIAGWPVVLAKPQTYMNVSGPSVRQLLERYELGPSNLLLVYDELALPWRQIRIRPKGSSGGHNGVESVIRAIGSQEFARLRLGIHPGHPVGNGAEFVLAPFRRGQYRELDELLDQAASAVESIIAEGVDKAMTKFNRRAQGSEQQEK
jgi:PTH1 family peptidyl-tRNA hydrolase